MTRLLLQHPPNEIQPRQIEAEILSLLIAMKNNNKSDYTIKSASKTLKRISKHANLHVPEQVKAYIANKNVTDGTKSWECTIYNMFCRHHKIDWEMPKYKRESKHIKIPTKEKLEMLIASSRKTSATKLKISMETGIRPIELCNLKVKDIDFERRLIMPTTAKGGNPRTLKISQSLTEQIQAHIIRKNLSPNDKLFKVSADAYSRNFIRNRNALAKKLKDPTIRSIRLYDFRHYFATMLYHKTRDILYVKQQMGHKRIETTLIYTQLLDLNDDEWTCKVAKNVEQDAQLIENGFEYVTERDGLKIYRKRK